MLREYQTKIKEIKKKDGNASKRNAYYDILHYKLMVLERRRPLDDQFPYVRGDIDKLLEMSTQQTSNINNFFRYIDRRSKDMEEGVNQLFEKWLEDHNWKGDKVPLDKGQLYHIINGRKKEMVQWDGIYSGICQSVQKLDTIEQDQCRKCLFLIETKETGHPELILNDSPSLFEKGQRTFNYLETLSGTGSGLPQDKLFRDLAQYSIIIIFACGQVVDEALNEALSECERWFVKHQIPITIWFATCPRMSYGTLEDVSNFEISKIRL